MIYFATALLLSGMASRFDDEPLRGSIARISTLNPMPLEVASGEGSGFFLDEKTLVTNWHVVQGATKAKVVLSDNQIFEAKRVLAVDRFWDLALLEVDLPADAVVPLSLAATPPEVGAPVRLGVLGSIDEDVAGEMPANRSFRELTGKITRLDHFEGFGTLLRSDVPVEEGDSGSPMVSATDGTVLGVWSMTSSAGSDVWGYAVPAERLATLYQKSKTDAPVAPSLSKWFRSRLREPEYMVEVSRMCLDGGRPDVTIQLFDRIVAAHEARGSEQKLAREGWYWQGCAHLSLGNVEEEEDEESEARALHHYREAARVFRKAREIRPASVFDCLCGMLLDYQLAYCLYMSDEDEESLQLFLRYVEAEPDDPDGHFMLGLLAYTDLDAEGLRARITILEQLAGPDSEQVVELKIYLAEIE